MSEPWCWLAQNLKNQHPQHAIPSIKNQHQQQHLAQPDNNEDNDVGKGHLKNGFALPGLASAHWGNKEWR